MTVASSEVTAPAPAPTSDGNSLHSGFHSCSIAFCIIYVNFYMGEHLLEVNLLNKFQYFKRLVSNSELRDTKFIKEKE